MTLARSQRSLPCFVYCILIAMPRAAREPTCPQRTHLTRHQRIAKPTSCSLRMLLGKQPQARNHRLGGLSRRNHLTKKYGIHPRVIHKFPECRKEMSVAPTAALKIILKLSAHIWSAEVPHHQSVCNRDPCLTAFYCFGGSQVRPRHAYPSLSGDAS